MSKNCQIVQDLIPLVNDGIASEESQKFVYKHCEECEECRSLLTEAPQYDESALRMKWKKKIRWTMLGFIVLLSLLACSLTSTEDVTQNIIIVPFIGGIGYVLLKRRVYVLYPLILVSHVLVNLFQHKYLMIYSHMTMYWFF